MPKSAQKPNNRGLILDAAIHKFAEKGYYGASMRDIAKACGLNLPSLYYHYENKEQLFREVLFKTHDDAVLEIERCIVKDKGLEEEIVSVFSGLLNHHRNNPERTRVIFRMVFSADDDICNEYSKTKGTEFRAFIHKAFKRNRPKGDFRVKLLAVVDTLESFLLSLSFPNQKTNRAPTFKKVIRFILEK